MSDANRFPAKLGFKSSYGPCDEGELRIWEAMLPGGKLPEDYRDFLLQWNGGEFDIELASDGDSLKYIGFSIIGDDFDGDANDAGLIEELAGLFDRENINDVRRSSLTHGFRGAVPDSYIAIGGSYLTTSQVCISVNGEDFGAVYYWGGEPWEEKPTTEYLFPVAANFSTFWKMIQVVVGD